MKTFFFIFILVNETNFCRWFESHRIWVSALIIDEICDRPSHWRCQKLLEEWLTENGIPAICGVDTRTLTKHIRESGTLLGKIVDHSVQIDKNFKNVIDPNKINLVKDVSISVSKISTKHFSHFKFKN